MPISLAELFGSALDSELCSVLWTRIVEFYHNEPLAADMPEPERVVFLVLHSMGIIQNGGFIHLFEGEMPGDPDYSLTVDGYERIRCEAAAEVFREAFELFDGRRPPAEPRERLHKYRRGDGARRGEIDKKFWAVTEQIEACLADYAREHRSAYDRLDGSKPPPRPKPISSEPRQLDPVSVLIAALPHWVRVAFAVYCARRVFAFFDAAWPDALPKRREAAQLAISLAEQSAAAGRRLGGLKEAGDHTVQVAGAAAIFALHGIRLEGSDEIHPPDGNSAAVVGRIAHAAGNAARAANSPAKKSAEFALSAYGWTRDLADAELLEEMAATFRRLGQATERGRWTHRTAVPQAALDPDFMPSEPPRPWWKFW